MMTRSHGVGGRTVLMCLLLMGVMLLIPACSEQGGSRINGAGYSRQAAGPSEINWDRLTARARAEDRPVYLLFAAPWCPNCRKFDRNTLSDSQVRRTLNREIFVRANIDREKELGDRFGVTGVPTGVLLKYQNGQLRQVDKHVGGLEPGNMIRFLGE